MLELRLVQGSLLKKVVDSIKDLANDAKFPCSSTGFCLQGMDSTHVSLVKLLLRSEGFEHYRCDMNLHWGMNLGNMPKMLNCAGNDDIFTIKADDGIDTLTFMFESPIVISVTEEGVMFKTRGDTGTAKIIYGQNTTVDKPEEVKVIEMNEPVYQIFDLEYINSFTKATPLSSTVTINLASKIPVMVEYKIAEMGYLRFYLPPEIG